MKIRVNKNDTDVASIANGECFWHKRLLYMRVVVSKITNECLPDVAYAVLLTTGTICRISSDVQVEKADCMVISAEEKNIVISF